MTGEVGDKPMRNGAGLIERTRKAPRAARPGDRPEDRTEGPGRLDGFGLGRALTIRQVAHLIGCSVSVVRYRLIPRGLPHFRASEHGKYWFYVDQVRAWILARQQEGGRRRRGSLQTR